MKNKLTIGTRSSKLALYQSNLVKSRLEHLYPDITFELQKIKTKGDIVKERCKCASCLINGIVYIFGGECIDYSILLCDPIIKFSMKNQTFNHLYCTQV